MMKRHVRTVYLKELLDTVRDRKTLLMMILVPLLLMAVLTVVQPLINEKETQRVKETQYKIVVNGERDSENFKDYLKQFSNISIVQTENSEEKLGKGEIQLIIGTQEGFDSLVKQQQPARLVLQYDGSSKLSQTAKLQAQQIINGYIKQLVSVSLNKRGISPELLVPITLEEQNKASRDKMNGFYLSMILPLIITVWAVIGGMYTAIDVAAGEKERGTLETLLMTPLSRTTIVMGKFLAILTVAMGAVMLAILSMVITLKFIIPLFVNKGVEQNISLPLGVIGLILFVASMLTAFISALELTLSTWARNFKQAQNYITPLYLVVMIPALVILTMQSFTLPGYLYLIPIFNTMQLLKELFAGQIIPGHLFTVTASSLGYIYLAFILAVDTFNKEKVVLRT